MTMEEGMKRLQQIAGDRYCGIEHRIAQYNYDDGDVGIKSEYRIFIEIEGCPHCNNDGDIISVNCHKSLELALTDIETELKKHLNERKINGKNKTTETA